MSSDLKRLIEALIEEEFAAAPQMGDIDPTPEDDEDRPLMDKRPPGGGMDVSQHHKMMWAEGEEPEEGDAEVIEEMSAIGGGGAGLASTGKVSATSAGSAWKSNNPEHELMWSGDEAHANRPKPGVKKKD